MLLDFILPPVDGITVLLLIIVVYFTWQYYNDYNLPPGPWGLPVVGYLPFMGHDPPEITFLSLSKKYGEIMSMKMGNTLVVVLNNFEVIKEAFVKHSESFMARPAGRFVKLQEQDTGVLATDGELWKEHRRFTLSTLRDHGMGKSSLEPMAMEEIHYFLDELNKLKGKPVDPVGLLGMSTANIIASLEFGKRFEYTDKKFTRLRRLLSELLDIGLEAGLRTFFPWIDSVPFTDSLTHSKQIVEISNRMKEFLKEMADEHKKVFVENSKKDFIDAYFTEREEIIQKTGGEGTFNDYELGGDLEALFIGGTETITTTLRWAFLAMILHPKIQEKVQKEIDEVVGMERSPSLSDKSRMLYTEAVLLEVQRFGSIATLNIPHANYDETELCGYRIPKRTVIFSNLYAVHRDPKLWERPEDFWPDRFIKDGKIEKPEFLIPFGIGKRQCLGESLARMELFLYFTSLLQRFTIMLPEGITTDMEPVVPSTGRRPKGFEFCAIQRKGYNVN